MKLNTKTAPTQRSLKMYSLLALVVLCFPLAASAQGNFQGKLWVVDVAQASDVTFPAPTATPDATFSTDGIAYIGQQETGEANAAHCYTIGKFLNGCGTHSFNLQFSGLSNPNLPHGKAASSTTAMSGGSWGIMIELTGEVGLTNGSPIQIIHDDGVAVKVDGNVVSGFNPYVTVPNLDSVTWTGTSGTHSLDLLYANAQPAGAWLLLIGNL
jgi:hypothetical protein